MNNQSRSKDEVLEAIANELPPVVFRNWKRWRDVLPMSPRSVANEDCLGKGPGKKVYVGRVVGYPRNDFIDYLRIKMRTVDKKSSFTNTNLKEA